MSLPLRLDETTLRELLVRAGDVALRRCGCGECRGVPVHASLLKALVEEVQERRIHAADLVVKLDRARSKLTHILNLISGSSAVVSGLVSADAVMAIFDGESSPGAAP